MIKLRQFTRDEIILHQAKKRGVLYNEGEFYRILNGNILSSKKEAPFRDKESLRVINEIDHAELVEGEWYAMVTPFGKTCLSALSSGSKFALTVINNSRRGIYTEVQSVGDNVWRLLSELEMDILIAVVSGDKFSFSLDIEGEFIVENTKLGDEVLVSGYFVQISNGRINTKLLEVKK